MNREDLVFGLLIGLAFGIVLGAIIFYEDYGDSKVVELNICNSNNCSLVGIYRLEIGGYEELRINNLQIEYTLNNLYAKSVGGEE